jgi:hypothetical protein
MPAGPWPSAAPGRDRDNAAAVDRALAGGPEAVVEIRPARSLAAAEERAPQAAVGRYGRFLRRPVELRLHRPGTEPLNRAGNAPWPAGRA